MDILHVDDEPAFGELVADFLEMEGDEISVSSETNPSDALARIQAEEEFDGVISDYDMPEKNGIEFLKEVRAEYPDLPFILFTGKGSEEVASEAISAGATDYLQKGGGTEQYELLANRIENAVKQRQIAQRAANLDRLRTLVAEVNQEIVRATSGKDVEERVCRVISESDPYRCAQIGRINDDPNQPELTISTEKTQADLDEFPVPITTEPTENDPAMEALRERTVAVSADTTTDSAFDQWDTVNWGIRSVAAVPLTYADDTYGVLVVYASEAEMFDRNERTLLGEVAGDTAHGIHGHEVRSELERFRTLLDRANDAVFMVDPETAEFLSVSERTCEMTNYSREEILNRRVMDIQQDIDTLEDFHDLIDQLRKTDSMLVEGTHERKDGSTYPVEVRLDHSQVNDQMYVVAIARDISDRKARERELERYERIMENLPIGVFRTTVDGEFVSMNEQFVELWGADEKSDFAGIMPDDLYVNEEDREQLLKQVKRDGLVEEYHIEMETLNGEVRWMETTLRLLEQDGNRYLDGVVQDVTDERERTRRLEQAQTMFENAQDGLFLIDVTDEFVIERVNPAYEELTGMSQESIKGHTPREVLDEESGRAVEQRYNRCVKQRKSLEYEEELPIGGKSTYWETQITPVVIDGDVEKIVGATRNITDRKKRERELQRAERRYQAILEDPNILAAILDTDGTVIDVNQTALEYVDVGAEDVEGKPFWETAWWAEEVQPAVRENVQRAAEGEYVEYTSDNENPDGEPYSVEGVIRPVTNENGTVVSLIVSARDVTERVIRETRLEAILENAAAPLFMKDRHGEYLLASKGWEDLFDVDSDRVIGRTDDELFPSEMAREVQQNDTQVLETGEPIEVEEQIIVDGEERVFLSSKTPVFDIGTESDPEEPVAVFGVANDITEQKTRQKRLEQQNDRFDELASAVSHDLQTPLETARGRVELAVETGDMEHAEKALDALHRTDELRQSLVTTLRTKEIVGDQEPVDVGQLGHDAWSTVTAPDDAALQTTDPPSVKADPEALQRLLENLLSNAVEHGGENVTVRIGRTDDGFFIEDDGPGIPPAERDDVFTSGYSTKSGGTGVGLASVRQVVLAHDWSISITEGETGGTRFEITGVEFT